MQQVGGLVEGFGRGGVGKSQPAVMCPVWREPGAGQQGKADGGGPGGEFVAGDGGQAQPEPEAAPWRGERPGGAAAEGGGEVVALTAQFASSLADQEIKA